MSQKRAAAVGVDGSVPTKKAKASKKDDTVWSDVRKRMKENLADGFDFLCLQIEKGCSAHLGQFIDTISIIASVEYRRKMARADDLKIHPREVKDAYQRSIGGRSHPIKDLVQHIKFHAVREAYPFWSFIETIVDPVQDKLLETPRSISEWFQCLLQNRTNTTILTKLCPMVNKYWKDISARWELQPSKIAWMEWFSMSVTPANKHISRLDTLGQYLDEWSQSEGLRSNPMFRWNEQADFDTFIRSLLFHVRVENRTSVISFIRSWLQQYDGPLTESIFTVFSCYGGIDTIWEFAVLLDQRSILIRPSSASSFEQLLMNCIVWQSFILNQRIKIVPMLKCIFQTGERNSEMLSISLAYLGWLQPLIGTSVDKDRIDFQIVESSFLLKVRPVYEELRRMAINFDVLERSTGTIRT